MLLTTSNKQSLSITNISDVVFLRLLLVFAIFIGLLTYGYEITNFSLSIDEEVHSFDSGNWKVWVSQGRWGMGILVYIFPHGLAVIPFLPTILFALGLSLSAVMFSTVFTNSRECAIGFISVFVSSPIWLHIGEFNTLSWGFSIGLIVTAIATYYLNQGGFKNSIIAGVCIGFSLAIYQALFILYLTTVLIICINKEWDSRKQNTVFFDRNTPIFINVFTSVFIALGIYYSMNNIFLYLSGSKLTYLNNFINLSAYSNGNGQATIIRVLNHTKRLLLGTDPTFLGNGIASLILFWFGVLLLVIKSQFDSNIAIFTKLYAVALSFGILLLAMSLILLSAGFIPTRALIVFPFLYALLSAIPFECNKCQKLLWLILGVTLFTNIYIANSLFYADHVARQRDLVMATRLIDRIEDVGRSAFGEKIPLVIVGQWQHELGGPALRIEIFGDSFFEHDGGNPYRVAAYLRLLGCRGLVPLPITEIKAELQDIKLHPSWPAKEAVFRTKNVLIVKLSELSYQP